MMRELSEELATFSVLMGCGSQGVRNCQNSLNWTLEICVCKVYLNKQAYIERK